jgi:hypothetical protein
MNGNPPAHRMWLAIFLLGLVVVKLLVPLSEPLDSISFWAGLAIVFYLFGVTKLEERRERKADQSA